MIIRLFLLSLALMAGAGPLHAKDGSAPPSQKPEIEIVSAEFGRFEVSNTPDETIFVPAIVVPHRSGQRYGWVIELRSAPRSVSVREEYLLAPTASAAVEGANAADGSRTLVLPRRSQVSQRQLVPVDNRIYGEWAVGPGEPAGHRRLEVIVEDVPAAHFEFDVE